MREIRPPLLVFGEDWGAHPSSTQHLVQRLVNDRSVLWVNSIGLRRPRLSCRDFGRVSRKIVSMVRGSHMARTVDPHVRNLKIVNANAVSWPGSSIARAINRRLIPRSLKASLSALEGGSPILWTSLPSAVDAVGACGERAVVYYAGDDFSSLAGVDHEPVSEMEYQLANRANLIIAASHIIARKFPAEKTRVLQHGCDFRLFSEPAPRSPELPNGRHIAGFYGSLSDWLDVNLISETARLLPDWLFYFVGPVQCDVNQLKRQANVRILGPRPHASLPSYVQHWTVSLIPFKDTPQIRASNPLKLREYLAAGTPVVTTDFPALAPYREHVAVGRDPTSFAKMISDAADECCTKRKIRQKAVEMESWESRATTVSRWLDALR